MSYRGRWHNIKDFRPVIIISVAAFFCELGFSTINISTLPAAALSSYRLVFRKKYDPTS